MLSWLHSEGKDESCIGNSDYGDGHNGDDCGDDDDSEDELVLIH